MICEIDVACSLQVLFEVLVTVWANFGKIDGRVVGGMQLGVLVRVKAQPLAVWPPPAQPGLFSPGCGHCAHTRSRRRAYSWAG